MLNWFSSFHGKKGNACQSFIGEAGLSSPNIINCISCYSNVASVEFAKRKESFSLSAASTVTDNLSIYRHIFLYKLCTEGNGKIAYLPLLL